MPMDSISMCSNTLYMSNMNVEKQFEVAASLNHDVMTSFQLHNLPKTPKSELSRMGITV